MTGQGRYRRSGCRERSMLAVPGRNHVHLSLSKNAFNPHQYVTPHSLPRRCVIPVAISSSASPFFSPTFRESASFFFLLARSSHSSICADASVHVRRERAKATRRKRRRRRRRGRAREIEMEKRQGATAGDEKWRNAERNYRDSTRVVVNGRGWSTCK